MAKLLQANATLKIFIVGHTDAGVANYAPLGSNATDLGRARNRRVELVVQ